MIAALGEVFEVVKGCTGRRQQHDISRLGRGRRRAHRSVEIRDEHDIQSAVGIEGRDRDRRADLLRRVTRQNNAPGQLTERVPQRIKGDMLIIAADDDDGLALKGAETGDRPAGAGTDRVVDIGRAPVYAHDLQPMLHAGEAARDRGADHAPHL